MVVESNTRFPRYGVAILIDNAFRWNDLLRTSEVSGVDLRLSALEIASKTVVYDDIGLQCANHLDEVGGSPSLTTHFAVGEVKPHDIYLSVVGEKLSHLSMHVVQVVVKIVCLAFERFVIPHRVMLITIGRIVRMVPV